MTGWSIVLAAVAIAAVGTTAIAGPAEPVLHAHTARGEWQAWGEQITWLAGTAFLAISGVAAWNRSLRTQVAARTEEIRAVAERLKFHSHVLAQVTDAVVVFSQEGRVTTWNGGAELISGIEAAEVVGRPSDAVIGALVPSEALQAIRRQVADTGAWRGEATIRRSDGTTRWVEGTVQVLRDDEGRSSGRLIVLHDIHARKLAEIERRRMEQRLQQVQRLESLGVLAGGIAHDFNNLLVGMLGHAGLAMLEAPPQSPVRERLEQIETCALRAAELTNQMLAYSGKARFCVQPLDLSDIVREMSNLLETAISKSARLDLRLAGSLPAVAADGAQLRQVVMNLITNASDAVGERVGTITVTTGTLHATREYLAEAFAHASTEPGEYVYLDVCDTGCGMDGPTIERIFDPFFTTKRTGRGLGLAAVLGIVRGHGGAVRLQSAPGRGTSFRVLFPACHGAAVRPAAPPGRLRARKSACVLVVDDEPSVRAIAREALLRAGFRVIVAASGLEAVERMKVDGAGIDAALVDMTMPGMSGVETMRALRAVARDLPVVLTSGYSEEEAVTRCGGDAAAGFIQKPFVPAILVEKLNDAVAPA